MGVQVGEQRGGRNSWPILQYTDGGVGGERVSDLCLEGTASAVGQLSGLGMACITKIPWGVACFWIK